jgi:aminomethyltransferase
MATGTDRPKLLVPGLKPYDPAFESHWVRPGGATVLLIKPDDRVTIVDNDGSQQAELTVLSPDGRDDSGALGAKADAPASVLRDLVAKAEGDSFLGDLHARGLDPSEANAVVLFGPDSPPGNSQSFTAEREVVIVVAAPAGRVIDGAHPASAIDVEINRAVPHEDPDLELPAPLAETRLDFRVDAATATSYTVKKGEYIQVMDVKGRQCSDFLAFNEAKLQNGLERGLDATATRTLMGNGYPQPGLHRKFFDADLDPLLEVVQDTVGRHDTFALACTKKYYEDMGYFGHISCSENFNGSLEEFPIAPRNGWPAINFFFNTGFDADLQMTADEPWSRPGDYVLMRALTDLVCSSSACPDDIDPANGWEITDIQVRVYEPENKFSMAIAHRVTPEARPVMTKETGFHERISALTSTHVDYRGYWLPTCFNNEGPISEYWACREKAVIMDLSPLRKWEILGPDAELLMQWAVTRDIRRLAVGQVVYTAICNETGGMIDDATVFRLGEDNFRFVGGDPYTGVWLKELAEKLDLKAFVKPSTDELHNVAVQGPASRDILKQIIWTPEDQTPLEELKWFRFLVGRIGDYDGIPVLVSRTGYSGELGYEVFCHPDDGTAVWDAIWEAGKPFGLTPLGLDALDLVRIESGLVFAGYEFDDQVDPFEAGIGFTVVLDGDEDFIGKDALIERKAHPQHTLVGLELEGNETAAHGDCVHVGKSQIGVVTSAMRSPLLKKNIALCRIAVQYSEIGTEVEVGKLDGQQKRIPATVVRFPFYDPDKERPRS